MITVVMEVLCTLLEEDGAARPTTVFVGPRAFNRLARDVFDCPHLGVSHTAALQAGEFRVAGPGGMVEVVRRLDYKDWEVHFR